MTDLTTHKDGMPIIWRGHACEGFQIIPSDVGTFILWTRCGKHDVPANAGHVGKFEDIHCSACVEVIEGEIHHD